MLNRYVDERYWRWNKNGRICECLQILFVGVNDGPDNTEDKEKMAALQKKRGLMDDASGARGPIVIALYDEEDDSASGDDDGETEQTARKAGKGKSRIWVC